MKSIVPSVLIGLSLVATALGFAHAQAQTDTDADGVPDQFDNCVQTPNGPLLNWTFCPPQFDYDGDGYGNPCDGDFDGDGVAQIHDYKFMTNQIGSDQFPEYDLDCSGRVDTTDNSLFLLRFTLPPGPAGGG